MLPQSFNDYISKIADSVKQSLEIKSFHNYSELQETIIGPNNEVLCIEARINQSISHKSANGTPPLFYLRAGNKIILDHRTYQDLDLPLIGIIQDNLIFLNQFIGFLNHPKNVMYTALTICAMDSVDFENKQILDLGCAEGILSLIALKKGAKKITGIDIDSDCKNLIFSNLQLNRLELRRLNFINSDIQILEENLKRLDRAKIEILIANIGPHFGNTDLLALNYLKHLPNVKVVIGGGYCKASPNLHPQKAFIILTSLGFKRIRETHDPISGKVSFIAERN